MDPNDDEAPKDPGSTRQYTEKDFEGKQETHQPHIGLFLIHLRHQ